MACIARIHDRVQLVTEPDIAGVFNPEDHFFSRMTFYAFGGGEGLLCIMTGATGFTFFHRSHGVALLDSEVKNGIMAYLAIIFDTFLFEVPIVVEDYFAEIGYFESYVLDVNRISQWAMKS